MRAKCLVYWLRSRLVYLLSYLLFFLLLLVLSYLFGVHRDLVAYAILLMATVSGLALAYDGVREYQQCRQYVERQTIEARTGTEALLMAEIKALRLDLQEQENNHRQWQADMEDYYTMWAHQMKTPLAASHLLIGDLPDPERRLALEKEWFKLDHYTGLVLQYLRLHSFHQDLVVELIDLDSLIRTLVKKYSLFFIEGQIQLELGSLDYQIQTDSKWFSLLVEQFLSNAIKYSPQSQIAIRMEGDSLVIADKGLGIAKSDLQRVFERGFTGYNGRRTQQSSGLGLYLARQVGQKLGYAIQLDSELGQGTTVRIKLKEENLLFR